MEIASKKVFEKVDQELKFFDCEYIGITATILLIKDNKIYCANVADSKSYILYDKTYKQISSDHNKISIYDEKTRVESMRGIIRKNRIMGQLILKGP